MDTCHKLNYLIEIQKQFFRYQLNLTFTCIFFYKLKEQQQKIKSIGMHLKIDTKQKIKYIKNYLAQIKSNRETMPFITINYTECGFYDFQYITKRGQTISDIQKNLKENKYETVREVCEDLKLLYLKIGDYLLLNDPLQEQCSRLIKNLSDFQTRFSQDFKQNRLLKPELKLGRKQDLKQSKDKEKEDINKDNMKQNKDKQKQKQNAIQYNRRSSFAQKLEMFFYLKSHEDNMEYIKCIGDGYSIGKEETDGDYVIKLDSAATSCPWLELLQKKEQ